MRTAMQRSAFALVILFVSVAAMSAQYQVTDLGPNVFPTAINNRGVVAGVVRTQSTPGGAVASWPFVWRNGVLTVVQPAGWSGGSFSGLNNSGVAVGQALFADGSSAPFSYSNGIVSLLPVAPAVGSANAINDNGVIGGFLQDPIVGGFSGSRPFVLANGAVINLPGLGGIGGGVKGINITGTAAGVTTDPSFAVIAAMWVPPAYALQVLPTLGGNDTNANAINDNGVIAGSSSFPGVAGTDAVLWQNGVLTDLGSVPNAVFTSADGLNNRGAVVGNASNFSGMEVAFVYQNGAIHTLNDLAGASTGWTFEASRSINDNGDIAGWGLPPNPTSTADVHGFLLRALTPAQMISAMMNTIQSYGLNTGNAQSLESKLAAVESSLGSSGPAACNQLRAFVNEVNAQAGKSLTTAQANELRTAASNLAAAMGC